MQRTTQLKALVAPKGSDLNVSAQEEQAQRIRYDKSFPAIKTRAVYLTGWPRYENSVGSGYLGTILTKFGDRNDDNAADDEIQKLRPADRWGVRQSEK